MVKRTDRHGGATPNTIVLYAGTAEAATIVAHLDETLRQEFPGIELIQSSDSTEFATQVESKRPDLAVVIGEEGNRIALRKSLIRSVSQPILWLSNQRDLFVLPSQHSDDIAESIHDVPTLSTSDDTVVMSEAERAAQAAHERLARLLRLRQLRAARRQKTQKLIVSLKQRLRHMQRLALEDPLTRVLNRRGLKKSLTFELDRAQRYRQELACIVCDLDHFKSVNDSYGHLIGDQVLVGFARLMRRQCRKSDLIGRIGGEEFCILLPSCSLEKAAEWAEKVRTEVGRTDFGPSERPVRITASFGVVAFDQSYADAAQLIDRADHSLLRAKAEGRNRVIVQEGVASLLSARNPFSSASHVVRVLFESLLLRDPDTADHSRRVARLSAQLCRHIGLHENEVWLGETGGLLHDIGKVGVPTSILRKPTEYDNLERQLMERSLATGVDMVRSAFGDGPLAETVQESRTWYCDAGHGPASRRPTPGRAVAVVDAFDSMTSASPYRAPMSKTAALAELRRGAGTQFDAELVNAFAEVVGAA